MPLSRSLLALLFGASTMTTAAMTDGGPVTLAVEREGAAVTLLVRGAATAAVDVTYELNVQGGSTLHQRGRATLSPGGSEQLVRATISADRPWRATLRVTADGQTYTQERSGD